MTDPLSRSPRNATPTRLPINLINFLSAALRARSSNSCSAISRLVSGSTARRRMPKITRVISPRFDQSAGGRNALFFAGDLGQRIFQQPFSWKALGVNVTGRSTTLKVHYRTSHQIRETADRLLPGAVADVDGLDEERKGTVSVFNGPAPLVVSAADAATEQSAVAKLIVAALADGIMPEEIGVFVRTREVMGRAREAVKATGCDPSEITLHRDGGVGAVRIGVMHFAKGLEFKAVAVMACDDDVLPLKARLEAVADETELDDVFDTER